jgi:hypothetical protein
VDIVALYDPWRSPASHADWMRLFNHVSDILRRTSLVSGVVVLGDKCGKLKASLNADVVPGISPRPYSSVDPVMVYSRAAQTERPNFPRTHYRNGVAKNSATEGMFKPTVRMLNAGFVNTAR